MKLGPHETELVGTWIVEDRRVRADALCERIHWLTARHLRRVATCQASGGWDTLFQDPDDGRYWERSYPESGMHGGGPPALKWIPDEVAAAKYGLAA